MRIDGSKIANVDKGGVVSIEAVDEPATLHMVEVMREMESPSTAAVR